MYTVQDGPFPHNLEIAGSNPLQCSVIEFYWKLLLEYHIITKNPQSSLLPPVTYHTTLCIVYGRPLGLALLSGSDSSGHTDTFATVARVQARFPGTFDRNIGHSTGNSAFP